MLKQYPDAFAADGLPHFSLSHVDRQGVEVHLKSPPAGWRAGDVDDQPSELEMLDDTLLVRLFDYAHARWGRRFSDRVIRLIRDQAEALLTGESLWVANEAASGRPPEHGVLLARVVRCDGEHALNAHPVALSLGAAVDVAERMRKYLRTRSAIAPEWLGHPNSVRYLLRRWQNMIEEIHEALAHSGSGGRRTGGR